MEKFSIIRLIAIVLMIFDIGAGAGEPSAPSAARGKQTFIRVGCYACHGTEGQGSGSGAKLGPETLPLEALTQFVRTPSGFMPPYSEKILSDAEVADMLAFLKTVRPSPSPDRISILRSLKLSE